MPGRSFVSKTYQWWRRDIAGFWKAQEQLLASLKSPPGVFASDALIAWGRTLGFLDDKALTAAWDKHARQGEERGILWRTAVLAWAARMALTMEGDFVECGCYAGTTARILMDAVDLSSRRIYLYDLFEKPPEAHAMPEHGATLHAQVLARFPEPNVRVIRGLIPDSFSQGLPEQIAFAHIDMNNAPGEIAALKGIEDRLVLGAIIVLDDFGQLPYQAQHEAETVWFARRGLPVLEIPTGQGIVIWRPVRVAGR